jgi:Domain of unknown function (DUF5666)
MNRSMPRVFALCRLWLAALLVAACGGGVETGGTGATGASYVEGPITGFGSIIVAGVRFDEANARIEDADGGTRGRDALRLGLRVEIDSGTIADDGSGGRVATATRVRLASDLLGPVTAVDAQGALLAVLGQAVRVTTATVVDGVAGGAAALAPGAIVEVSGFIDPGASIDRYVATRIERRAAAPAAYRVRGLVRELDAAARTLRVGGQVFDLSVTGVPDGVADGKVVRMTVATAQVAGRWPVTAIAAEARRFDDRDEAEVEGLITALTSVTRFTVNGIDVDASAATFVDGSGGVLLGARVKVRGRAAGGTLIASTVDVRSDDDAFNDGLDLRDVIANLDAAARTFSVRGVTVFYGDAPEFRNGTVADLANDKRVRVRAILSADRTRAVATRIEFVRD